MEEIDKEIKRAVRRLRWRRVKLEFQYHWKILTNKRISRMERAEYFFMQTLFRRCDGKDCRCDGGWAYFAAINTAYHDEMSNYMFGCKNCHAETNEYYDELWAEYWSSRL